MPTFDEICRERNPDLREVMRESEAIHQEMLDMRKEEIPIFLRSKPMERARLQAVYEMRTRAKAK